MNKSKIKNILLKVLKLLYYIVIVFVCLLAIFLLYYVISAQINTDNEDYKPKISIYTIVSPSMTPVINVYDVVINTRVEDPEDIHNGDIITYISEDPSSEGMTITHRVIEVSQLPDGTYEYMTQGDNNDEPDSLYVKYDQVIGKEILIIPKIGKVQFILANQKGWLFLLLIPVCFYAIKEIIKLIDLLGLRRKVNEVTGITTENIIDKRRNNKELEEKRKEQIKEELKNIEIHKDSLVRSESEQSGFLEEYKETFITVNDNKYKKQPTPKKEEITDRIKEEKENLKETINKVKTENIKSPIEVLDTDELTSKIKEYDTKIEKLDKIIADIEKISKPKKETNSIVEIDNYLQGNKIKVTKVEETKNKKQSSRTKNHPEESKKNNITIKLNNNIENQSVISPRLRKIEKPSSEDIKELRTKELKETKVKEEPSIKPETTNDKPTKRNLNLNPSKRKKIIRKKKEPVKKTLIEIKKVK